MNGMEVFDGPPTYAYHSVRAFTTHESKSIWKAQFSTSALVRPREILRMMLTLQSGRPLKYGRTIFSLAYEFENRHEFYMELSASTLARSLLGLFVYGGLATSLFRFSFLASAFPGTDCDGRDGRSAR